MANDKQFLVSSADKCANSPGLAVHEGQEECKDRSDCHNCLKTKRVPEYVKRESKALVKLAWGMSVSSFISFFIPTSTVIIIGHKGKNYLAAIGLAMSVCNLTGNVFALGLTSACETLCSQAFGAGNHRRFGILIQRATIITFIAILPSCALWINMDRFLLLLKQEQKVALLAGEFTLYYVPGLFFYVLFSILTRYYACQNIVYPTVYASILAAFANGSFCYLFVFICDLGMRGGALAIDVAYLLFCLYLIIHAYVSKGQQTTWYGWSLQSFVGWKEFINLALPATFMTISEFLVYELGIISIGMIGSAEQATLVILLYVSGSIYFIAYGISIGTAVRVGSFLGSGQPRDAINCTKVSLFLIVVLLIIINLPLIAAKDFIAFIFTTDRTVVRMVSDSMILLAFYKIFNSIQLILLGTLRGVGFQRFGALINFVGYLCIGIPTYLLLIFEARMGVIGFWLGSLIANLFQDACLGILLLKADWNKLSTVAQERSGVSADEKPNGEVKLLPRSYGTTAEEFVKADNPEKCMEDVDESKLFLNNSVRSNSKSEIVIKVFVTVLFLLTVVTSVAFRVS